MPHRRSWLFAFLILAASPALVAQAFVDVTAPAGLMIPSFLSGNYGCGACCGDFDGDGDLDLIVGQATGTPFRYFRNDGGLVFTDVSASSGLGLCAYVRGISAADVDNDGDLDLFVCNNCTANALYINDGTGTFSEQGAARGVADTLCASSASFGDYDRDGWLDLYVGNYVTPTGYAGPNILYRNNGNGTFTDVSALSGAGVPGLTFAAPFVDYDKDGWPDIFIANDKGFYFTPNALLHNNHNGTFSDVSATVNANQGMDGMGADFVDAFNDGGTDFFVTDNPPDHLFLAWDAVHQQYVDVTYQYGLTGGAITASGWSCNFLDYDNDGWQDLHVVHAAQPNHLYRNPGVPALALVPWPEVSAIEGVGFADSQVTSLVADFDDDGRLDILSVLQDLGPPQGLRLLRNVGPASNWLKIRTRGTVSNRDGFGARVRVTVGSVAQEQEVRSGVGYISDSDHRVHFGLGAATVANRVDITWPSGQVQVFLNVPANQILEAVEPRFRLVGGATIGTISSLEVHSPAEGGKPFVTLLALGASPGLPLPSGRVIPANLDFVALYTLAPGNPVLPQGAGLLPPTGTGVSPLVIPNVPALIGVTLQGAAVTADALYPDGIRTIFPALPITFQSAAHVPRRGAGNARRERWQASAAFGTVGDPIPAPGVALACRNSPTLPRRFRR